MKLTIVLILFGAALVLTLVHASKAERCPLWVPVLLDTIALLLAHIPLQ